MNYKVKSFYDEKTQENKIIYVRAQPELYDRKGRLNSELNKGQYVDTFR